jgi:ATP-binding protein involved in chromosome partitioning
MGTESEPEGVELSDTTRTFVVRWADGKATRVSYKDLRDACRCAGCIDELTGKKTLVKATIPDDIGIGAAEPVGHYGIRFAWTDGHDTGIYTWVRLRELGVS